MDMAGQPGGGVKFGFVDMGVFRCFLSLEISVWEP
jgi:hypothetical protein